jgi:hypothetical protein
VLEERLLHRFGSDWFIRRGAGTFLMEVWEAESSETPEILARTLTSADLDPIFVRDRCRP